MSTKQELLRAASALVADQGSAALTLEAVARRAGVSKGGLLYHFPNKKALIAGMVGEAIEVFERAVAAAESTSGDWLLGYVEATLADLGQGDPLSGVFTAVAEDPDLLVPFRAALGRWYRRAEADYGPPAVPILLALDALWLHLRLGTLPEVDRQGAEDHLRILAQACRPQGAR